MSLPHPQAQEEARVKYMVLIHSNPASREVWEGFSDAERAEGLGVYAALDEELAASGELIVSEALADPSRSKVVSVREGRTIATDGPFAEAKEHLAGFYLLECGSLDRALAVAARIPEAALGLVEVRPVRSLSELARER
jgi:hypothetical protein